MPEGHHNWQSLQETKAWVMQFHQQIPGVFHWAQLQPGKPTSEMGSLQCKSHFFHMHYIHACPSDLSFTSRWVLWPAEINSYSSGNAAGCYPPSFPPHHALDLLLTMHPCWQFCSPWLFCWSINSLFLQVFWFLAFFSLFSSPVKSFKVCCIADTLIYEAAMY